MRFLIAVILFIASATMTLVGLAERTIWHPPANQVETIKIDTKYPLVIVKSNVLTRFKGNPTVTVESNSKPFMAVGRQTDIDAWVASTPHAEISADTDAKKPTFQVEQVGGWQASASPVNSDLWRTEVSKVGAVKQIVNVKDHAALLLANNGFDPAPTQIRLSWGLTFDEAPSRNLVIFGIIGLALAFIMNLWAWYEMRKTRGPRRRTPRAPQGPRTRRRRSSVSVPTRGRRSTRSFMGLTAGVLILSTVTGCSHRAPVASPTQKTAVLQQDPPVVTSVQIHRIVKQVAQTVAFADTARNPKLLETRVTGPALTSRTAYYALQKTSKTVAAPMAIPTAHLSLILPAQTSAWPRTVMAIATTTSSKDLPQMLVLEQDSPREQYKLWYNVQMLPGVKLPEVNKAKIGAIPVSPQSQFLKITPQSLPVAFGEVIDNGPASVGAAQFDVTKDEFYSQIRASQLNQQQSLSKATIKVTHSLGNPNVVSLSTTDGGALVAVYLSDQYVITPKDKTHAVALAGNEKLMLGSAGSTKGIRSVYGSMLLFYDPAATSADKVITVGATQTLISVRSL